MGIKHFFSWFKNNFKQSINYINSGDNVSSFSIDNLMIDMNGIFHESAQKIYRYGKFKTPQRLLSSSIHKKGSIDKQIDVFRDVCNWVEHIIEVVSPRKRVILCVDGPAPLSKQKQQRQRRFMSSLEKDERVFDSNSITPGTKFMDYLSKYIDWYIKKRISEGSVWSGIEVIFSNEKCPGEGEHKLISFIRKHNNRDESYCIYGMDADLIMLSLGTHVPKFYILRDEPMGVSFLFYFIDINSVRKELSDILKWKEKDYIYKPEMAINDFIFMCFSVGNDFLPHIPGIEIIEGAIQFMIDVYKNVGEAYGHITENTDKGLRFRKKPLRCFLGTISQYEKGVFADKLSHKEKFFQDTLLEKCSKTVDGKYDVDIEKYHKNYYETHFPNVEVEKICHEYLEGMQWVLSYYSQGVSNWTWSYPYHYAPFSYDLGKYIKTFKFKDYSITTPTVPFLQLLSVLPPNSAELLPSPLNQALKTEMGKFCPEKFEIDIEGKRQRWEGTAILPMIETKEIEEIYFKHLKNVDEKDMKRNRLGKSFVYTKCSKEFEFFSFYGNFICSATSKVIDL